MWSPENITIVLRPEKPRELKAGYVKEIVMRSFTEYLKRPGHVSLPKGFITDEQFEKERNNPLLRAKMLWKYWHGTWGLGTKDTKIVSQVRTTYPV